MIARCLAGLWIALVCLAATAAEPSPESTSQPDATVSVPDASSAATAAKPAPEESAPAPAKSASTTEPKTGRTTSNDDFKPSEEISEDMAVAYPVDI